MFGAMSLVSYGIQNENSHVRAHVCVVARKVYVYATLAGITAIRSGAFRKVGGYQPDRQGNNLLTAYGYLVPPPQIKGCREANIPNDLWQAARWKQEESTTEKGRKAVITIQNMLLRGVLPLPAIDGIKCKAQKITDTDLDIDGTDIEIFANIKMQVKCDYRGGSKERGGTGNLYLQVSERNPLKRH